MSANTFGRVKVLAVVVVGVALGGLAAIPLFSSRPSPSVGTAPISSAAASTTDATAAACESSTAASAYEVTSLYRAESTTAGEVAAWQEQRHPGFSGVSELRVLEPTARVLVCIFRGSFVTPAGPPDPSGAPRPPHDLIRFLVMEDGAIILDAAGHEGTGNLDPETPSDWRNVQTPPSSPVESAAP